MSFLTTRERERGGEKEREMEGHHPLRWHGGGWDGEMVGMGVQREDKTKC